MPTFDEFQKRPWKVQQFEVARITEQRLLARVAMDDCWSDIRVATHLQRD